MMYAALTNKRLRARHDHAAYFAATFLASRNNLHTADEPPPDIGPAFKANGLRGLVLPRKFGGSNGEYLDLAVTAEALTHYGGNLGIVLSWLVPEIIAGTLAVKNASTQQLAQYLPGICEGDLTVALAVSEPGVGAIRDRLAASAELQGDRFFISGEKAFVTNAPMADLFIVIAVTGCAGGKKELSAFLTPADTPGLIRTHPHALSYLRPCQHGGIVLKNCVVPSSAIVGKLGAGYETAIRVRAYEDVLMMSLVAGAISAQLDLLAAASSQAPPNDTFRMQLGKLRILQDAVQTLAYHGASLLKGSAIPDEALSISIACRNLAAEFQAIMQQALDTGAVNADIKLSHLAADLAGLLSIAKNVAAVRQKKFGSELIKGARCNELPSKPPV